MKSLRLIGFVALAHLWPAVALAGKKKAPEAAAPAVAEQVPTAAPDDAKSQKFLGALLEATLKNFSPSDGGAQFKYDEARFSAGNVFVAKGFVEMDGERMDCTESGTWKMDPAESEKVAAVEWTLSKTDCAGREAGVSVRVRMTIDKGAISTEFR